MAEIVSIEFLGTKGPDFYEQFKKEYTSSKYIPLKMHAIYPSFLSDLFYVVKKLLTDSNNKIRISYHLW